MQYFTEQTTNWTNYAVLVHPQRVNEKKKDKKKISQKKFSKAQNRSTSAGDPFCVRK